MPDPLQPLNPVGNQRNVRVVCGGTSSRRGCGNQSLVLAAIALIGCSTPEARQRQETIQHYKYLEERARLITVDPSDGISEVEAYKIGKNRFDTYGTACGAVAAPVDLGDYWRVVTCVGYAGLPCEELLIRKSDGVTTIKKIELPNVSRR